MDGVEIDPNTDGWDFLGIYVRIAFVALEAADETLRVAHVNVFALLAGRGSVVFHRGSDECEIGIASEQFGKLGRADVLELLFAGSDVVVVRAILIVTLL